MEAAADDEWARRAFRSTHDVDRDLGSHLAFAQAPSSPAQGPRRRRFPCAGFTKGRLRFAASRFSAVFDPPPCFGRPFDVENSIFLTQMPVVIDKELFQLFHEL